MASELSDLGADLLPTFHLSMYEEELLLFGLGASHLTIPIILVKLFWSWSWS